MEWLVGLVRLALRGSGGRLVVPLGMLLCFVYVKLRDARPDKRIPMAHYDWPIFGNLIYIMFQAITHPSELYGLTKDIAIYGKYWVHIPPHGMQLVISDPPSVKCILEDVNTFVIPPLRTHLYGEIFGRGIFLSNGDSWSHQRSLAKPVFSVTSRQEMYPVYNQCARNLVSLLDKHSQTQEPIELQELFKRFTLDTFSSIGFGYPMSSLLHPVPFSQTFDWLLEEVNARWRFPWRKLTLQWLWKAKLEELDLFVLSLIEERRKMGWQGKADFLSKLLELEANKEIDEVTPNFLRDQVVNFLLAGRDTTAILLAATIYYLSFHPDVEAKVRREVEEVVGEEEVGMRHTGRLKYLGNVLDEVLRVFPPAVPFNHRYVTKDVVLPNGACLPKGVMVMYSPYTLHRLKEYWGEDAEEFKPERWEKEDLFKHPYQYVPFQKGPRICLGMKMAIEEAKTCISIIYQHGFKFSLVSPPPDKINFLANAILSANNGIFVNVHKTTL